MLNVWLKRRKLREELKVFKEQLDLQERLIRQLKITFKVGAKKAINPVWMNLPKKP